MTKWKDEKSHNKEQLRLSMEKLNMEKLSSWEKKQRGWKNLPLVEFASRERMRVLGRNESTWSSQERQCLGTTGRANIRSRARRRMNTQIIRYQRGQFRKHITATSGRKKELTAFCCCWK